MENNAAAGGGGGKTALSRVRLRHVQWLGGATQNKHSQAQVLQVLKEMSQLPAKKTPHRSTVAAAVASLYESHDALALDEMPICGCRQKKEAPAPRELDDAGLLSSSQVGTEGSAVNVLPGR